MNLVFWGLGSWSFSFAEGGLKTAFWTTYLAKEDTSLRLPCCHDKANAVNDKRPVPGCWLVYTVRLIKNERIFPRQLSNSGGFNVIRVLMNQSGLVFQIKDQPP